jgi:hypothetical protein
MQREYLTENSHVFEEIIEFGLGKFEIESKYAVDLIRTNKLFYLSNRAALKDLLASIIKHKPMYNAFLDWLDAISPIYLIDSEIKLLKKEKEFGPRDFVVANHEDVLQLKDRIDNLEKRIEVLLDLIEELAKKV